MNIIGRRRSNEYGYTGPARSGRYFEGWYLRQVNAERSRSLAVIVGLSLSADPHAFIQLITGPDSRVRKYRFPLSDLRLRRDRFEVVLGSNFFSTSQMILNLPDISGNLLFDDHNRYPQTLFSPTIMGPFAFVPFMECVHGVLSPDHKVDGEISIDGESLDFTDGRGYIEKDRGRSMPKGWIWAQCNQFAAAGTTFMLSVARIPWLGSSFNGHLGFLRFDGRFIRFGTYAGSRVLLRSAEADQMALEIRKKEKTLTVRLSRRPSGGILDAPVEGSMSRSIQEEPWAAMDLVLLDNDREIWRDSGFPGAVEIVGKPEALFRR